jgi:hypothetical protein
MNDMGKLEYADMPYDMLYDKAEELERDLKEIVKAATDDSMDGSEDIECGATGLIFTGYAALQKEDQGIL